MSILVSQIKNLPGPAITARLEEATAGGAAYLDVLNRGRPVARLAYADGLPAEWRASDPATVPLTELKRSEVSIAGLRRGGQALYLTQRSGPTLALWPLEKPQRRLTDESLPDEVAYLQREVRRIRIKLERLAKFQGVMIAFVESMRRALDEPALEEDDQHE